MQMLEFLDQEYYENAVKKYGSKRVEDLRQKWEQKEYDDGWKEGYEVGRNEGRAGECVHSIRSFLTTRFPNEPLSENYDYALETLGDIPKLRSIRNYCFGASSTKSIEAFIESKVKN